MKVSERLEKIPPYLFAEIDRKIAEAKAKGCDVISLGIGDPDTPTLAPVQKCIRRAVMAAVVVFPFVPVMPIIFIFFPGSP